MMAALSWAMENIPIVHVVTAIEMGIELIPPSLPAFDIFEHALVPLHELLSKEERDAGG